MNLVSKLAETGANDEYVPSLLVIDDDPVHQMVIGKIADKAGYAVTTTSSVEDAKVKMESSKFDCISLDLSLGGRSGSSLLAMMAASHPNAQIIIISGATAEMREETLKLATSLHLKTLEIPKPVDLGLLRSKLVVLKSVYGHKPPN